MVPFLPEVIKIGQFPLGVGAITGLVGAVIAYFLAGWMARRNGAESGPVQDVLLNFMVGGIFAAKLIYVVIDPLSHLANPLTLVLFPYGPMALPAGLVGGVFAVILGLRKQPNPGATLDRAAFPLLLGLALALTGWQEPGSWAFAPSFGVAAVVMAAASRQAWAPGHRAAAAAVLASCALVLADLARPVAGVVAGITLLQLVAALVGTTAWLWLRRPTRA